MIKIYIDRLIRIHMFKMNIVISFIRTFLSGLAYNIFDIITNLYTCTRLAIEPYNPFKPQLKIHLITYFFDYLIDTETDLYRGWLMANSSDQLGQNINLTQIGLYVKPTAISIHYSFSDWNEKYIKLISLRDLIDLEEFTENKFKVGNQTLIRGIHLSDCLRQILEKLKPDYNALNYDYTVEVISNSVIDISNMEIVETVENVESVKSVESVEIVETVEIKNSLNIVKSKNIENINFENLNLMLQKFPNNDKYLIASNLDAYLRRATTWECEQTLSLLSERPDLMEFIYFENIENIDPLFKNRLISFVVSDELGTKFKISY